MLAGSGLYLTGAVAVTIGFNVPRNEALARVESTRFDTPGSWARYLGQWTAANHVRTLAAIAATVTLTIALHVS